MKNVYAYTRVSTVRQGTEGSSLSEQKAAICRYAEANHLHIVQWFEEQETAAKQGRPVFSKLFRLLAQGKATGVIIHKIDRSARNLRDWADLGELVDRGIEIHLAHESLDMTSRGGRLAADIQAVVAADYVRNLRQEVRKGIQGRLKQGLLPAPAPPGYLNQGGGKPKIPDPVKAPLVRRLFEMYATRRYSYHDLIQEARVMGLNGRNGRPLSRNGLTHLFHNEFYIGVIHHKVSGERYPGVHEPIVSIALFNEVQKALSERRSSKVVVNAFAYRRMIRCTGCSYHLVGERQKGRVYYRCHTRTCPTTSFREDDLTKRLGKALAKITLPADALPLLRSEFDVLMEERFGDREAVRRSKALSLAQIDDRLERLTDRYLDGDIERAWFLDKKAALIAERAMVCEQVEAIDDIGKAVGTKVELYFERQERLSGASNSLKPEEIAALVDFSTSNVCTEQQDLLIDWKQEFLAIQELKTIPTSGPHRDRARTFTDYSIPGQHPFIPMSIKILAKEIFNALTTIT